MHANNLPRITMVYLSLAWICMYLVENWGKEHAGRKKGVGLAKGTAVLCAVLIASLSLTLIYLHFFPITPN